MTRNTENTLKALGFVSQDGGWIHLTDGTVRMNMTTGHWQLRPHFARITYRGQGIASLEAKIHANRQSR